MQIYGNNVVSGGGYGGDIKTPLPTRTLRDKPKAPPSPTTLRFSSDIPADKVRSSPSRKGIPLGPRPDNWVNPFATDSKKVEQIIEMYEEGHSSSSIAEEIGCSKTTVINQLRKHGVEIRPVGHNRTYRRLTNEDIADMRSRYYRGESLRSIAVVHKVAASTVKKYL